MPTEQPPPVLWQPPAEVRSTTRIGEYQARLERERDLRFDSYADLWNWSVTDLEAFWRSISDYFDLRFETPPARLLTRPVGGQLPGTKWGDGATLNYAEHALRLPGRAPDDAVLFSVSQSRPTAVLTAAELREQVANVRAGLLRLGVGRGDRVAAYLPNVAEAVVGFLATASIGAVWSSCAPEFGTRSVVDRFAQIEPVVLLAANGYRYGDRAVDRSAEVSAIRDALPTLKATVVLRYLDGAEPIGDTTDWSDLAANEAGEHRFEFVPFDHPLYVLYSSGTTGLPKPIVHGHGGILLEHHKVLGLHHDLGPGDRFLWFSTTGWMMWNYLVSGLCVGASIVCFDGNPGWPDLDTLWRTVDELDVTFFGTSAPFLMACRKDGVRPGASFDLSALRGVGSTGAPLPAEGFRWVYEEVGDHVLLSSASGGTDVCTAFVGGCPLVPVWEGEISCRYLGARVEAFDADGHSVVGEQGELVITAPMPSMPVGFWGDDGGERYRAAYFSDFPGVWRHGDWITITDRGSCVISGRSDATLNRGGVRVGTAEFYAVVEDLPEVVDSLVVHLDDDDQLVLFVALAEGVELDGPLRDRLIDTVRNSLSPRHVPDRIMAVPTIPRTLSGKKLEVPVKRILTGTPTDVAASRGSLANPEALDAFAALASDV